MCLLRSQNLKQLKCLKIYRFGHEDGITSIDSMKHEQAVSSGGRDTTVRLWKVVTESQLVFNGSW